MIDIATEGLDYVTLTTDRDNIASQRVIEKNGGYTIGRFPSPIDGNEDLVHWRIDL